MADVKGPRVSVLMTVYNGAPFLDEAVRSVVNQTAGDWELIVIENGSTDDSPGILARYTDPRIRVEWLVANIGRTPALRRAFELARGEYVAILDADDLAHPDRFATEVAYLDGHPDVVLVGTWTLRIDAEGGVIGRWAPPVDPSDVQDSFGWTNPIVHSSAMYRRAAAAEAGGYPDDLPYAQDCGLWLRLAERGTLAMIGEFLCSHRIAPRSITQNRHLRPEIARDNHAVLMDARRRLRLSPTALRRNREELTIARCRYGIALAQSGHTVEAARVLGSELISNPTGVLWNRVVRSWLGR